MLSPPPCPPPTLHPAVPPATGPQDGSSSGPGSQPPASESSGNGSETDELFSGDNPDPFNTFNIDAANNTDSTLGRRKRTTFEGDLGLMGLDFNFNSVDHSALVRSQSQRRRLNAKDELALTEFSQKTIGQQLVVLCAMGLETAAIVRSSTSAAEYKISPELKKNILRYSTAFVLSPRTSKYMDGGADAIIASLRIRGIAVPSADNLGHLDIVKSQILTVLGDKRNKMKNLIDLALPEPAARVKPGSTSATGADPATATSATGDGASAASGQGTSATQAAGGTAARTAKGSRSKIKKEKVYAVLDIATLCKNLVGESGVRVTIEMYHRVAYLRHVIVANGSDDDYWRIVDDRLKEVRDKYPSPAAYEQYFKLWYEHDVSLYGAPARNGFVQRNQLDAWQTTVETESLNAAGYSDGTQVPPQPL